jgi:hypothetical protein
MMWIINLDGAFTTLGHMLRHLVIYHIFLLLEIGPSPSSVVCVNLLHAD